VRRKENRGVGGAIEKGFAEFIANHGIEAAEGFIENDEFGTERESAGESGLHAHAPREMLELAVEGKIESLDELSLELRVPGRIERAKVGEKVADAHPARELLVFGDIADGGEGHAGYFFGIDSEGGGSSRGSAENVH
jgi:hypothetical protein